MLFVLVVFMLGILVLEATGPNYFAGNGGKGRGIILCMGPIMAHYMGLFASVKVIREDLKSKLPIEIWMYDYEWPMLREGVQIVLTDFANQDVSVHFLKELPTGVDDEREKRKGTSVKGDYVHFSTKPRALLESTLDEVLLLDSDALLFLKPEDLFNEELYKDTGTLFLNDKPIDWWPAKYEDYDSTWLETYIRSGYARKTAMRAEVAVSAPGVTPPRTSPGSKQTPYRSCMGVHQDGRYCTQHRQESSLVLFNKRRQQRCAAVLWDLTVHENVSIYERIYGDKESYWLACELAGSPYAFSPWAPGHWGAMNATDSTCPDLVIEPHFLHFLPGPTTFAAGRALAAETPRLLSVNQLKIRAVLGGRGKRNSMPSLAVSPRMTVGDMHDALVPTLTNPEKCPRRIAPFRRMQRCWSRHLLCSSMNEDDLALLRKHAGLQQQARAVFNGKEK